MKLTAVFLVLGSMWAAGVSSASESPSDVAHLKQEILALAQRFKGQADPDFSKQRQLDERVQRLVQLTKPAPVRDRLPLLTGVWEQVWGPYNYRGKARVVDPTLDTEQILQEIRSDGTYYNACYTKGREPGSPRQRVVLRGEWVFDPQTTEALQVRFTDYWRVEGPAAQIPLADVTGRFAEGRREGGSSVVPSWIVRLFFGKGLLREVYTDNDLRILYGQSPDDPEHAHIYVMRRIAVSPGPSGA